MTNPVRIRLAETADAAPLSHLIGTTWAKYFAYSVTEQDLRDYLDGPVSVEQIRRDIANPDNHFLVAVTTSETEQSRETTGDRAHVRSDAIIGVVQLVTGTTEPCLTLPSPIELRRLYLSSDHHGSGTGSVLLRAAEDFARQEKGDKSMWLGVWEDNARGMRFYAKEGFERVGEHWFMVGQSRRRDWIMQKAL